MEWREDEKYPQKCYDLRVNGDLVAWIMHMSAEDNWLIHIPREDKNYERFATKEEAMAMAVALVRMP